MIRIMFGRSGGFAGSATAIEGNVTFNGGTGRVASAFGYQRDLGPDEIEALRTAIGHLSHGRAEPPVQLRDAYQYDVRIIHDDGSTESLTVHGDPSPGRQDLFGWVRQECDRIWAYRASRRAD
jgi:hypothetical protein